MVLESLLAGIWFVNVYVPSTLLDIRASSEKPQTIFTPTGVGAQFGYGFSENIAAFGEYEFNYNLQTQNVYLSGFDAGAKIYLAGGLGVATQNELISSFVAPKNSLAFSIVGLQRSFNLTQPNTIKKADGIVLAKPYQLTGNFFALGSGLTLERVIVNQNLRFVLELLAARSLSVSTAIKFNLYQGRIGLTYQM